MIRDNLEHGWLLTNCICQDKEIGYCEFCGKTLYSDEYYKILDGDYYCEECYYEVKEKKEIEND